jgi:hypothetical protein
LEVPPRLLSLGALVSESLSTRRDSVRAPDRLCVDEDRLDPEDRLRELEREREDDRLLDLFEEPPLERLFLLLDRDFCGGIRPALLINSVNRVPRLPESFRSTLLQPAVQICSGPFESAAQRVVPDGPPVRKAQLARKPSEAINPWPRQRDPRAAGQPAAARVQPDRRVGTALPAVPGRVPSEVARRRGGRRHRVAAALPPAHSAPRQEREVGRPLRTAR